MVCVAVLSIAAAITIPRYMSHVFQERQAECVTVLRELQAAEQNYFREHGQFTDDLRKLGWQPPPKPLYLYGFRESRDGVTSSSLNPIELCPPAKPDCYVTDLMRNSTKQLLHISDLPESQFEPSRGFVIGCVGNIDSDPELDRLSIDQAGQLTHISNDLN